MRIVATFRSGDAANRPRERFVYHRAGMNGRGSSSYMDDVILRERSDATPWTNATPPATLSDRLYYLQNWRHDVIGLSKPNGQIVERPRYTSYGVPRTAAIGDFNHDGLIDNNDFAILSDNITTFAVGYSTGSAAERADEAWSVCDLNMDGGVDNADFALFVPHYNDVVGVEPGRFSHRDVSTEEGVDNRLGYGSYRMSPWSELLYLRNRVMSPSLGILLTRDQLQYVDGANLYVYVRSSPVGSLDPSGNDTISVYCRPVKGINWATGVEHCFTQCCDSSGRCSTLSLLNGRPGVESTVNKSCIVLNAPEDNPKTTGATLRGSQSGPNPCRCMREIFSQNKGCNYPYKALSCNSNWFASSVFIACTGRPRARGS